MHANDALWRELIACDDVETVAFAQANGLAERFRSQRSVSADYIASLCAKMQASATILGNPEQPARIMCRGARGILVSAVLPNKTIVTLIAKNDEAARRANSLIDMYSNAEL
jgi:hypothetical protein